MIARIEDQPRLRICGKLGLAIALGLGSLALADEPVRQESKAPVSPPVLVSHQALEGRLGDTNLRILDVRPKADYEKTHIPGAVWVDSKSAASIAGKPGGLTNQAAWSAWIEPLGIDSRSGVLVYGGNSPVDAARTWWLLRYLGVERVGLIDGGFPLWVAQKRAVASEPTKVTPRPFPVKFARDRLATKDDVLAALKSGSAQIVDARSQGEYTGATKNSKRGGHIPEACWMEWSDLVDKEGRFLDEATLKPKLTRAGVKTDSPAITHCQGGGRASLDAFVLERLGMPTRNYYLGWSDWGNLEETPVTKGDKPK